MGKLVPLNKIFCFTKEDKKSIEEAFKLKDSFDENVFPYSEIPDKDCIYTKDDCNTKLAYVSYIGDLYNWDWMFLERGFRIVMSGYGFSDNASQVIHYAKKEMKDDDKDYCILLRPFKPTNDMDEKFCYRNGPYIGVLEKPPHESTLYGVKIPKDMDIMFQFSIYTKKEFKHD